MKELPHTPKLIEECLLPLDADRLFPEKRSQHPPRILILYGSLRERSYSRLVAEEAARILERLGPKCVSFIRQACLWWIMVLMQIIRKLRNCVTLCSGARA